MDTYLHRKAEKKSNFPKIQVEVMRHVAFKINTSSFLKTMRDQGTTSTREPVDKS